MDVAVLIPWRPTSCPHRTRAFEFVTARYAQEHPDWQVAVGVHESGPWCKAKAVNDALAQTQAEILIVADADVWAVRLGEAVRQVGRGAAWAIPHRGLHRLNPEATALYLADPSCDVDGLHTTQDVYTGFEGGGITVFRRDVYIDCPLDSRFVGWGSEDEAHSFALRVLHSPPWRVSGYAPLVHLWHPPQERARRHMGSLESWDLRKRYARARDCEHVMRTLIEEAKSCSAHS